MPDMEPLRGFKAGTVCTVAQNSVYAPGQKVTVERSTGPFANDVPVVGPFGRRFSLPPDFLIPEDPAQAPKIRSGTSQERPKRTAEYQAKKKARKERANQKRQALEAQEAQP